MAMKRDMINKHIERSLRGLMYVYGHGGRRCVHSVRVCEENTTSSPICWSWEGVAGSNTAYSVTTYPPGHGGQVPHVDHDGPAGHHSQQVVHHVVLGTVPEGISKTRVILTGKDRKEEI